MDNPVSEETARARWMAINAVRVAGVAMVLVGILGLLHLRASMIGTQNTSTRPTAMRM